MAMVRKGRYTKKRSLLFRSKAAVKRRFNWFMKLSKPRKALVILTPILAFLIITPIVTYAYYYNDISDKDRLMNANNTGVALLDKNGEEFYSIGTAAHRDYVKLADISDVTKQALLSSEDKDFYNHSGFSFLSIVKALYANIAAGDATAYGGSTITQQLAKNTLLSKNQTIFRKYQELTIAMAIEQRYSKDEILEMYLNSVYFGNNSFGIGQAAANYFGETPSQLTLAQASMLIGVLPAPSAYSPVGGNMEYAKERQNTVLGRMMKNHVITESEKTAAYNEELTYQPVKEIDNVAPHFTEMVLQELYDKYGEETVKRSGYQVTTTLDLNLQKTANVAVAANTASVKARGGSNTAVVAVDPSNGQVRALVGSIDYNNAEFGKVNMATTPRQPGSSFKPIFYARAMADDIIAPASVIRDEKTTFGDWTPKNASGRFYGDVSVRHALGWSLNIPAVKVLEQVGIDKAIDQAKSMGITTLGDASQYGLTLALGSAEVPLTEMTDAYATFADGGQYKNTAIIASIENKYNQQIYSAKVTKTQAISKQGAYLISNVLSDTSAKALIFGSSLNVYGTDGKLKSVAVKTGTTDDARDALAIGYTQDIAVGVWVGNNDNTEMSSGGGVMAGPIWKAIMKAAIGSSSPEFTEPTGVIKEEACINGARVEDYFLLSTRLATSCQTSSFDTETKQTDTSSDTTTTNDTTTSGSGSDPNASTSTDTGTTTPGDTTTDGTTSTGTGDGTSTGTGTTGGTTPGTTGGGTTTPTP